MAKIHIFQMKAHYIFLSLLLVALQTPSATAQNAPVKPFSVRFFLTRFDQPRGMKGDYAPTRQNAVRVPGPNAVDWPSVTVDGKPVFTLDSKEDVLMPLHGGGSIFRTRGDIAVTPGDHWVRALNWLFGHQVVYTTDRTRAAATTLRRLITSYLRSPLSLGRRELARFDP